MARTREEIAAELAVLELQDELAAAKEYAADGPEYMDLKKRLREARRVFRSFREGRPPTEGEARPATLETSAGV